MEQQWNTDNYRYEESVRQYQAYYQAQGFEIDPNWQYQTQQYAQYPPQVYPGYNVVNPSVQQQYEGNYAGYGNPQSNQLFANFASNTTAVPPMGVLPGAYPLPTNPLETVPSPPPPPPPPPLPTHSAPSVPPISKSRWGQTEKHIPTNKIAIATKIGLNMNLSCVVKSKIIKGVSAAVSGNPVSAAASKTPEPAVASKTPVSAAAVSRNPVAAAAVSRNPVLGIKSKDVTAAAERSKKEERMKSKASENKSGRVSFADRKVGSMSSLLELLANKATNGDDTDEANTCETPSTGKEEQSTGKEGLSISTGKEGPGTGKEGSSIVKEGPATGKEGQSIVKEGPSTGKEGPSSGKAGHVTFEEKMGCSLTSLLQRVSGVSEPETVAPKVKSYPKPSKGVSATPQEQQTFPSMFGNPHTLQEEHFGELFTNKPTLTKQEKRAKYYAQYLAGKDKQTTMGGGGMQPSGLTVSGRDKSEVNFYYTVPASAYAVPEDLKGKNPIREGRLRQLIHLCYCKICSIVFPNTLSAKQHYGGRKHGVKIRTYIISGDRTGEDGNQLCCKVCNVIYSDDKHKLAHVNGKPHAKKVQVLKKRGLIAFDAPDNDPTVKGPAFKGEKDEHVVSFEDVKGWNMDVINKTDSMCPLCNIGFSSVSSALQHYHGKNHIKKFTAVAKSREISINDIVIKCSEEHSYECLVCTAQLNSRDSLNEHLVGAKHSKKMSNSQTFLINEGRWKDDFNGNSSTSKYRGVVKGGKAGIIIPRGGQQGNDTCEQYFTQSYRGGHNYSAGMKRRHDNGGYSNCSQFVQFQPSSKRYMHQEGLVVSGPYRDNYSYF